MWRMYLVPVEAQTDIPATVPANSAGFTAEQILAFADQLMQEKEYFRAITEYRRFLFHFPQDSRRAMAHFRIGLAFYRGEHYDEALQTFRTVAQRYPGTSYARQAWLWQGETLMRQAQYEEAATVYAEIIRDFPDEQVSQQARYQRGWTFLYRRQWRQASAQFHALSPTSPLHGASQRLAEEVLDAEKIPQKSPLLAGLLSGILPGSGQLYNGRAGDALLAFFLNGLFIAGIVEAIDQDETAIAGVLGFFEAGWYVGNVYGAVNGAHKHNRQALETFIRNLENRFRVEPPHASHLLGIRFSLNF
jgi:TolA-binding protein/TM2 domain-containing membrane protein YozV